MIRFVIPYPPSKKGKAVFYRRFGLNAYYAGKHWAARKKDAEDLHRLAWDSLRRAGVREEVVAGPVRVIFYWDDGLDADNHAVIGKAIVDALKPRILPEDNRKWVREITHRFWDGGAILVEISPMKEET